MDKQFSIESPAQEKERSYKSRILEIINEVEERVRVIEADGSLDRELHEKRVIDSSAEKQEYESVRNDICEAFGVVQDADHMHFYDPHRGGEVGPREQRAFRCFVVLIDAKSREAYYAEGRAFHAVLLNGIISKILKAGKMLDEEKIFDGIEKTPPEWIFFKGFLSTKEFKEISDSNRKGLETPLFDSDGKEIKTAESWFISGHNLEKVFPKQP